MTTVRRGIFGRKLSRYFKGSPPFPSIFLIKSSDYPIELQVHAQMGCKTKFATYAREALY
jgi:hypothetical protein